MATEADMKAWIKVIEKRLSASRITDIDPRGGAFTIVGKTIRFADWSERQMFFFFTDDTWFTVLLEYDDDDQMHALRYSSGDLELHRNLSIFFRGGLLSEPETNQTGDFYRKLDSLEYERREREAYERLHKKFGGE